MAKINEIKEKLQSFKDYKDLIAYLHNEFKIEKFKVFQTINYYEKKYENIFRVDIGEDKEDYYEIRVLFKKNSGFYVQIEEVSKNQSSEGLMPIKEAKRKNSKFIHGVELEIQSLLKEIVPQATI